LSCISGAAKNLEHNALMAAICGMSSILTAS
jgi:hypothetical protein